MPNKQTIPKSIRLNAALVDVLNTEAKKQNRTFNNMVETILKKEFGMLNHIRVEIKGADIIASLNRSNKRR